ncbi:head-tail connector protein [Acinetobacter sichuanensis]|uniref:Head-tail connector protein n=1 Tax=Acinetobacter sichuanensis TaxID=2136183 RepID=A0A371YJK7_9GAMM|nr:head-tail connector protein [Acinetobacter sichuanensis]RFC81630.1 phage gp6-like head-tail connector protein [Acinetobacter sichuanensis]
MIDLLTAKLHCRIDHDDEDILIERYIAAANEHLIANLDRKIIKDESERQSECDLIDNAALDSARLLHIGHQYANRESVSQGLSEMPLGYWRLIQPYRIMGV